MRIDNIDISNFNAKQMKVDIQHSDITIEVEWLKKALLPIVVGSEVTFKKIKIELKVKGNSRDEALRNISNLVSMLRKLVVLNLDNYTNSYYALLDSKEVNKTISKNIYMLTLQFKGYETGIEVIELINRVSSKTINVAGNSNTPAIVEITPSIDIIDITVEGLADDPITIKNLKANKKVILDGELQKVTVDGVNKYGDTDMWDFPRLLPGENTLKLSRENCNISIKYKSRWI